VFEINAARDALQNILEEARVIKETVKLFSDSGYT
jgi:hypothetical protein